MKRTKPQFKTSVTQEGMDLCAGALRQIGRHLRNGGFYAEYNYAKDWDFDRDDFQKNMLLTYDIMKEIMEDFLDQLNKEMKKNKNEKDSKFVISSQQMFKLIDIGKKKGKKKEKKK